MQQHLEIQLLGQQFTIQLPNVGQRMEIESRKQIFSKDLYGVLAKSDHNDARKLLNLVDAVSVFGVLIPSINMDVARFDKMELEEEIAWTKAFFEYYKWEKGIEEGILKMFETKAPETKADGAAKS